MDNLPKVLDKLDVLNSFQQAIDEHISKGVSIVSAMSGSGFPRDLDVDFLTWLSRGQGSGFTFRILSNPSISKKPKRESSPA